MNKNALIRVVDDDEALLKAIKFSLELDGFSVATYGSAEAFLENDDLERSGCIILDYQMPGLNGIEVQRLLSEQEIILPIIFLTAHHKQKCVLYLLRSKQQSRPSVPRLRAVYRIPPPFSRLRKRIGRLNTHR